MARRITEAERIARREWEWAYAAWERYPDETTAAHLEFAGSEWDAVKAEQDLLWEQANA